ncbi:MAG: heparin lyase I family protein, partial [Solirubrobacteraceae bacterium]
SVVWKADAESAMQSEWASSSSIPAAASPPKPDLSRIAQNPFSAQGQRSYRFEVRKGDDSYGARAELGQAMPTIDKYKHLTFRAGEERWIAMQYYLPTNWPGDDTWQTVMQIKPISPGGGGPSIGLGTGANKLKFYGNDNTWGSTLGAISDGAGPLTSGSYPMTKGRWIKLTWHIVFSADPKIGSIEVFGDLADGKGMRTLVPNRKRATMKYNNGSMDPAHLRVGIYRDPAITATAHLYVDGITVATTRATAEANAHRVG